MAWNIGEKNGAEMDSWYEWGKQPLEMLTPLFETQDGKTVSLGRQYRFHEHPL